MSEELKQAIDKLSKANNVLVTVNSDPSIDGLAACIGTALSLNKIGKHATAVFSGQVPPLLDFLKPEETIEENTDSLRDFIISLDKSKADKLRYKVEDSFVKIFITPYKTAITEADFEYSQGDFNVDVVLALGVKNQADLDQAITAYGRILHDATIITVNVEGGADLGSINFVNQSASSLSEQCAIILAGVSEESLDPQIATALLTGIVAETERFSNEKTAPSTMSVSSSLMAAGANQQLVASRLEPVPEEPEPELEEDAQALIDEQPAEAEAPQEPAEPGLLSIDHDSEEPAEHQIDGLASTGADETIEGSAKDSVSNQPTPELSSGDDGARHEADADEPQAPEDQANEAIDSTDNQPAPEVSPGADNHQAETSDRPTEDNNSHPEPIIGGQERRDFTEGTPDAAQNGRRMISQPQVVRPTSEFTANANPDSDLSKTESPSPSLSLPPAKAPQNYNQYVEDKDSPRSIDASSSASEAPAAKANRFNLGAALRKQRQIKAQDESTNPIPKPLDHVPRSKTTGPGVAGESEMKMPSDTIAELESTIEQESAVVAQPQPAPPAPPAPVPAPSPAPAEVKPTPSEDESSNEIEISEDGEIRIASAGPSATTTPPSAPSPAAAPVLNAPVPAISSPASSAPAVPPPFMPSNFGK